MQKNLNYLNSFIVTLILFCSINVYANDTPAVTITGKVIDALTEEPLPGANVRIKDTIIGDATDINGEFSISGVSEGEITLVISYLGFLTQEVIYNSDSSEPLVIRLEQEVIEGEAVVVSVQAQGQREAINQQIASNTAVNVVSSTKIQELPEANAAEAVGRLPGVTLQREGGEGNKVVIRGLSPQFNKIAIEGVSLSSTDAGNRSTDLSMISSFMLDGIEVTKAALPNQEADQIGGTVNFKLRTAPDSPIFDVLMQGGYNNLVQEARDYKLVASGGQRFLNKRLGVYANIDFEQINRSDNIVNAQHLEGQQDDLFFSFVNNVDFGVNTRINNRYGGTLVLDYKLPNTMIKVFGMFNEVNEDQITQNENINGGVGSYNLTLRNQEEEISMGTFSLEFEQILAGGRIKIFGGGAYNFSETLIPGVQMSVNDLNSVEFLPVQSLEGREGFEINEAGSAYLAPLEFPTLVGDVSDALVNQVLNFDSELFQDQYTIDLGLNYQFQPAEQVLVDLELGGKYKTRERSFDYTQFRNELTFTADNALNQIWYDEVERLGRLDELGNNWVLGNDIGFPYAFFLDQNFSSSDFFNNKLSQVLDPDVVEEFINLVPRTFDGNGNGLQYDYNASDLNDYSGSEDYFAFYVMPVVKIGPKLTLIPGFRYERNETDYIGIGTGGTGLWEEPVTLNELNYTRENDFFLPMLHVRYDVSHWFDIKASYTETLSRPDFNLLAPRYTQFGSTSLVWNNPDYKPIESDNYDLNFSFYNNKIGLLSIGGFYKTIRNFIFQDNIYLLEEDDILDIYPDGLVLGATVTGFINNPNDATLYGAELEWQSNFWFLPGAFQGLVFGVNYTYTYSETKYPNTIAVRAGFPTFAIIGTEDESYTARLLDQPDHALNTTLGFDYKGFSIRGSMRFQAGIFSGNSPFEVLLQDTDALTLYDLSVTQRIQSLEGLSVFLNASNISESIDQVTNQNSGWLTNQNFYGLTAQVGVRYKL